MNQLVLIRHSISNPDANTPSRMWRLSHGGRQKCVQLAERLKPFSLGRIISSIEPKAIETAYLTAQQLGIPTHVADGLQEHERDKVGFFESKELFNSKVLEMFAHPEEIVFGNESANHARERFSEAINNLLEQFPEENLGIVTHGTVMSLFVCIKNDIDVQDFWVRLEMPAYAVLSLPGYGLMDLVYGLGENQRKSE